MKKFHLVLLKLSPLDTMGADTVLGITSMLLSLNAPPNIVAYLSNLFGQFQLPLWVTLILLKKDILKSVEYD